jgi:hypothetical protein
MLDISSVVDALTLPAAVKVSIAAAKAAADL